MIDVTILNWKRPGNVEQIVASLKHQTIPCRTIVIENAIVPEFAITQATHKLADVVISSTENLGPVGRFINSVFAQSDHVLFIDDDLIPRKHTAEYFLHMAHLYPDVGLWSFQGRIIKDIYKGEDVTRTSEPVEVDMTIRCHFMPRESLLDLHKYLFAWKEPFYDVEDDMLLAAAIRRAGKKICLLPKSKEPEFDELPSPFARWQRSGNFERRQIAWKKISQKQKIMM